MSAPATARLAFHCKLDQRFVIYSCFAVRFQIIILKTDEVAETPTILG